MQAGLALSLKILPLMTPCGRCIKTELKATNRNEGGKLSSGIEQEQEEEDGIYLGGREGAISKKGHFFDQT